MRTGRSLWLTFSAPFRRLPADLTAVVVFTLLTLAAIFVPPINETLLRVILGLVFVLFLPGYAFVAVLFPEAGESPGATEGDRGQSADNSSGLFGDRIDRSGIDSIERVALSFGLSIAIVPLIGFVMSFTQWGIMMIPIVTAISAFTLACAIIAILRRRALPPENRFTVPYREWIDTAKAEVFSPNDRLNGALNVVLALSILLMLATVTYAITVPPQGEQFTEFNVLTEDENGELVADGYPDEMVLGDNDELVLGIENNEYSTQEYTIIVQLQNTETDGNDTRIHDREELDRLQLKLEHDEMVYQEHSLEPTMIGEDLRVAYLLYRDDIPATPTRENAYRDLHLWIDVQEPEE